MTHRIVRFAQARVDIAEIVDYLVGENVAAAERFLDSLEKSFNFLATFPQSGDLVENETLKADGVRLWQVKGFRNHIIIFRVRGEDVQILRVTPASRDRANLLDTL
jgi:plasmid stabilization system protein ParE